MSKVFELIREEKHRQTHNVELIASENYISDIYEPKKGENHD